jgi:DNA-binding NarL/FixJ family response regulator
VFDDDDKVYQALSAGASGYLLKSDAAARVGEALGVLKEGGAPISPMIARRLLDDFRSRAAPRPAASEPAPAEAELTPREREIIELFAKGATYEDVARILSMSVNTVRHHVRGMYKKLHVCSKAEAVTTAFRLA